MKLIATSFVLKKVKIYDLCPVSKNTTIDAIRIIGAALTNSHSNE